MGHRSLILSGFIFVVGVGVSGAKDKPHVPVDVLKAQRVYIDYRLASIDEPVFLSLLRQRIEKWGRFKEVRPKDDADLALIFDATPGGVYTLTIMDGSYHRVLWLVKNYGESVKPRRREWGPYGERGAELVDLLRLQIESEERVLGKPSPSTKSGDR
jgi:hypothetical protein